MVIGLIGHQYHINIIFGVLFVYDDLSINKRE